ncbi:serine hydrolase domain-containing protein [Streptomyces aidingensis]|uniref:CubicO group peptidase, beta-lactamase class C family n=1 Tax=Streptomyces aidingensis TaxID=910347 RepID=A0A1I1L5G7_9ACTN|nr:serine hydrolase domain-containing protein [Streptomyces aidingensis]SFC68195.1 CubicO group peptidase, beta-lactamase class C family [Streptomyces aidingensis]
MTGPGPAAAAESAELAALVAEVSALPEGPGPWCGGVVVVAGHGRRTVVRHAAGWALRHTARDRELPPAGREPVRESTLFDLASLTKLFTAVAVAREAERGRVALDERVAVYVPEFGRRGKGRITVRDLLTHRGGLPAELPLYRQPDRPASLEPLWALPPQQPPGRLRRYSDPGMIALGVLLERVTGRGLAEVIRDGITGPLGMADTRFGPVAPERAAATEDQRRPRARADRGMLRGEVHDENAAALGGVAGHAGLFGTAGDLARFCRALLAGGGPVLRPETVRAMWQPPGLGWELDQPWFMGELAPGAAGHTGFTGTSLVVHPASGAFVVMLATTVHPVRPVRPDHRPRAAAATRLARALRLHSLP